MRASPATKAAEVVLRQVWSLWLLAGVFLVSEAFSEESLDSQGAPTEAVEWLKRMSHAHREMSYQGVVTFQVDDHLSSYNLIHRVRDGREFEVLQPLDARGADWVRNGHSVRCVHPAEQLLRQSAGQPGHEGGALGRYYELAMGPPARVAGREAVTLRILPRDVFRLSYEIVLDEMTALPLKSETLGPDGRVLERFQFMVFDLNVPPPAGNQADVREVQHVEPLALEQAQALLERSAWKPGWVPDGFTLARNGDSEAETLSFTDGLTMFSVFLEPLEAFGDVPDVGAMRSGATVSYTQPMPELGYVVTVMGEVPLLTAEQVAKSVELGARP